MNQAQMNQAQMNQASIKLINNNDFLSGEMVILSHEDHWN